MVKNTQLNTPTTPVDLRTLPQFMRSIKSPTLGHSFQGAFPPLNPSLPMKSVYERAGFDVYKPGRPPRHSQSSEDGYRNFTAPAVPSSGSFQQRNHSAPQVSKPTPGLTIDVGTANRNLATPSSMPSMSFPYSSSSNRRSAHSTTDSSRRSKTSSYKSAQRFSGGSNEEEFNFSSAPVKSPMRKPPPPSDEVLNPPASPLSPTYQHGYHAPVSNVSLNVANRSLSERCLSFEKSEDGNDSTVIIHSVEPTVPSIAADDLDSLEDTRLVEEGASLDERSPHKVLDRGKDILEENSQHGDDRNIPVQEDEQPTVPVIDIQDDSSDEGSIDQLRMLQQEIQESASPIQPTIPHVSSDEESEDEQRPRRNSFEIPKRTSTYQDMKIYNAAETSDEMTTIHEVSEVNWSSPSMSVREDILPSRLSMLSLDDSKYAAARLSKLEINGIAKEVAANRLSNFQPTLEGSELKEGDVLKAEPTKVNRFSNNHLSHREPLYASNFKEADDTLQTFGEPESVFGKEAIGLSKPIPQREPSQRESVLPKEPTSQLEDSRFKEPTPRADPHPSGKEITSEIAKDIKEKHNMEEVKYPSGQGPCRKCHKEVGDAKTIWSKDGQLSGIWHRACFGCYYCFAPFSKGSPCYVFNDKPYCELHFHVLNGSICSICDKGIEGECLENEKLQKFHAECLTCSRCGGGINSDYFVLDNAVFCELDAIQEFENRKTRDPDVKYEKRRTRHLYV